MCVCLSKRIKKQNFFSMFVCSRNKYWKKNSNMGKNQSKWGKKQMFLFLSINSIRFIARNEKMNKKIDEEYSSKKINIDESNSNTHMAYTCPSSMIVLGENIKIPIFSNATVLLWWFFSSLFQMMIDWFFCRMNEWETNQIIMPSLYILLHLNRIYSLW